MTTLWFLIAAVAVPCLVAALTLVPSLRDRKRRREWDAWAERELAKHRESQAAKGQADFWRYNKKGRRL